MSFTVRVVLCLSVFACLASGQSSITGSYTVGQIPSPIQVYLDQSIKINLASLYPGASPTFTATANPTPVGQWNIDANTGQFTYTPDPADLAPFTLSVSDANTEAPIKQDVVIRPLGFSRPDADFVQPPSTKATAAPDDSKYLTYLETCTYGASPAAIPCDSKLPNPMTRSVEISGHTVVLESGAGAHDEKNGFYFDKLNYTLHDPAPVNGYVTSLKIYAETVTIRGRLWIPGRPPVAVPSTDPLIASVSVWAREMRFEDAPGTPPEQMAVLDVTPIAADLVFNQKAPKAANAVEGTGGFGGLAGGHGGLVSLTVQKFTSITSAATAANGAARVVANGGQGQKGGLADKGLPGTDATAAQSPFPATNFDGTQNNGYGGGSCNPITGNCDHDICEWNGKLPDGTEIPLNVTQIVGSYETRDTTLYPGANAAGAPGSGHDALRGGFPGPGGNGGIYGSSFDSSIPQSTIIASVSGGAGGASPPVVPGGAAGKPNPYVQLNVDGRGGRPCVYAVDISTTDQSDGRPSPVFTAPPGGPGILAAQPTQGALSWLHPVSARVVLDYMNDAFKAGNTQLARSIAVQYQQYFKTTFGQTSIDPTFVNDFSADYAETGKVLALIDANRDVYGNPAGYVPLLSLAANTGALTDEVNADGPLLYLANWLQINALNQQANKDANTQAQTSLKADITAAQGQAASANTTIGLLAATAASVQAQLTQTTTDLKALETNLSDQATATANKLDTPSFWSKALTVLAKVATVIPVYQPELGALGAGLDAVNTLAVQPGAKIDFDTVMSAGLKFASSVSQGNLASKNDTLAASLTKVTPEKKAADSAATINSAVQGVSDVVDTIRTASQAVSAPQDQIDKILKDLEAQDTAFQSMIKEVKSLNAATASLSQAIGTATDAMAQATQTINADLLSLTELQRASTMPVMDLQTVSAVNAMGNRAKARLQKYLYYVAKSYEYNLLKPYRGDLNLDTMTSSIQSAINTAGPSGDALPKDFGVNAVLIPYQQAVRDVYSAYTAAANNGVPKTDGPYTFSLTPDELATLNSASAQVVIDLSDKLQTILQGDEQAELTDLAVLPGGTGITVVPSNASGLPAQLTIKMFATGSSVIASSRNLKDTNQYAYAFNFNTDPTNPDPIYYQDTYDTTRKTLTHATPAAQNTLFLSSFLGVTGISDANLATFLFTYPSAGTQIRITKNSPKAQVTSLTLSASVQDLPAPQGYGVVSVRAPLVGTPTIAVSAPDSTGRTAGQGNFKRIYPTPGTASVTLTAPLIASSDGALTFQKWANLSSGLDAGTGTPVTETVNGASLTFTPSAAGYAVYQPVYVAAAGGSPGGFSISGTVSDSAGACSSGVGLTLTGGTSGTSAADGTYSFSSLAAGSYTVTPSKTGCAFTPPSITVTLTANSTGNNFTGAAQAGTPTTITLLYPPSGATGISPTSTLTWSAVTGATSYDVYFGVGTPPFVKNVTATSWPIEGASPNVTYTWKIVARGATSSLATSDSWSFTTGSPVTTSGLYYIPITPCHLVDTRPTHANTGPFGPPIMEGSETRTFIPASGACAGISPTAKAYSFTVTARPTDKMPYMTIWPAGQKQPGVSTLNAFLGGTVSNSAIVPAGDGGGVSVFVTSQTHLQLDINGYFDNVTSGAATAFYTLPPCRIADTRNPNGTFGGPGMTAGSTRDFPVATSACVPSQAKSAAAYSLNVTVVPGEPLDYLLAWPSNTPQPPSVITLGSPSAAIVADAAIVQASTGGSISIFASNKTDVLFDVNGYFGTPGSAGALLFHPITPCRVVDTRDPTVRPLGGPIMAADSQRTFPMSTSSCGIPPGVQAYSLNVTVVPAAALGFVTLGPTGQARPFVSTLNDIAGIILANAAIIPVGKNDSIDVYVTNQTHVILDINGYFSAQ